MQYPLYDYYNASDLTLEEILKHFIKYFYLRKHGSDKAEKVLYKVSDSSKMKKLFEQSAKQGIAPNYVDFASVINEMMYFMLQSNSTQALAVLAAAVSWNRQVNQHLHLKSDYSVRDDAIKIFKKFSLYEEMSQSEFEKMTNPDSTIQHFHLPHEEMTNPYDSSHAIEAGTLTKEDFFNNQDLVLMIAAEDAAPEVIKKKLEILLGKRAKTADYLKIEQDIIAAERELNEGIVKIVAESKYNGDKSKVTLSDTVLCDGTDDLYDEYRKKMEVLQELANKEGVCYTKIQEEAQKEFEDSLFHS